MKRINFVPIGYIGECLDLIEQGDKYALSNELFIEYEPNMYHKIYVACDNTDGNAWTDEFDNLDNAIRWLLDM